jgi:hypothetical protein
MAGRQPPFGSGALPSEQAEEIFLDHPKQPRGLCRRVSLRIIILFTGSR